MGEKIKAKAFTVEGFSQGTWTRSCDFEDVSPPI